MRRQGEKSNERSSLGDQFNRSPSLDFVEKLTNIDAVKDQEDKPSSSTFSDASHRFSTKFHKLANILDSYQ